MIPLRDTQPSNTSPYVTILIIAVNVLVFLYEVSLGQYETNYFIARYGLTPDRLHYSSLWTSMFLHGGWMHLIGNMWFLWLFGDNVEEAMGPLRYLIFYFLVGSVGALAQAFAMPNSTAPMIGASGAVAGALGGYAILFPRARIVTLVMIPLLWPVVNFPAWVFLGLWFVMQFLLPTGSGVAWMAHVGGFIAGI